MDRGRVHTRQSRSIGFGRIFTRFEHGMADLDLYGDLELPAAPAAPAAPAPKALARNLVWRRPEVEVVDLEEGQPAQEPTEVEELRPLNASKADRLYEDLEPQRARNLVWKAEKVKETESKELDAVPVQTQQQEAALQKAMAEDEKPTEAGWVAEDVEESSDDEVHLGEVLASQTGVKMAGAANARGGRATPVAQPLVASSRSHDCGSAVS